MRARHDGMIFMFPFAIFDIFVTPPLELSPLLLLLVVVVVLVFMVLQLLAVVVADAEEAGQLQSSHSCHCGQSLIAKTKSAIISGFVLKKL